MGVLGAFSTLVININNRTMPRRTLPSTKCAVPGQRYSYRGKMLYDRCLRASLQKPKMMGGSTRKRAMIPTTVSPDRVISYSE